MTRSQVQIETPSMEKVEYKTGNKERPIIHSMLGEVDVGGVNQVLAALDDNVGEKFRDEASIISRNILRLEEECRGSVEKIGKLKLKLKETVEKTAEMKRIRGVQSNLQSAVDVVTKKQKLEKSEEEELNCSMTTNLDDSPLLSSQEL